MGYNARNDEIRDNTSPAEHFAASDIPLLVSYIHASLLEQDTAKLLKKKPELAPVWKRCIRVQATLATKLRLTPQTRRDPKTVARAFRNHLRPSAYEQAIED